jgi:hypothetical protein
MTATKSPTRVAARKFGCASAVLVAALTGSALAAGPVQFGTCDGATANNAEPAEAAAILFPLAAALDGVDGSGHARVNVDDKGVPSGGQIIAEAPANYRFGQAVLDALMATKFQRAHAGTYEICATFTASLAMPAFPDEAQPAPRRTDTLGPAIMPPKAVKAGVDGSFEIAFRLDNRGLVSRLISVRGSPRGYSFERAAAASLSVWTFPESMAGNYTIRVDFDHTTSPTVEGGAKLPRSMMAAPRYPQLALDRERQGEVIFRLDIVEDGLMKALHVVSVDPEGMGFAAAAVASMRGVIFHPALAVSDFRYEVQFRLTH